MDSVQITVDGRQYPLHPTWKASVAIADQLCDPLTISAEATKVEAFAAQGMNYKPAFELDFVNSVKLLGIAARACAHDLSDEQIGESYVSGKMLQAVEDAAKFLGFMLDAGPEKAPKKPRRQTARRKGGGTT